MSTNFPGGVDSFTNPTSGESLNSPSHATQHANVNDAVTACENAMLSAGDVTVNGSGLLIVNGTANVESIIRANTPNQLATMSGNLPFGGYKGTGAAAGVHSGDLAIIDQLNKGSMPYVISGCVWTADSSGSTLYCSMSAGTVVIGGLPLTVAAVTSRAFTASNDTYIDLASNGDGTASITYTAVTNLQTSPVLANSGTAGNTLRVAMVSAGSSSVTNAKIVQGEMQAPTNAGTYGSTTVASGSNGANITAGTLDVASSSSFPSGGGWAQVAHSGGATYTIAFTGVGTGTLTGVTVVQGSGTVSTGDTVKGTFPVGLQDMLGNRIFPCSPFAGVVGGTFYTNAYTTTLTANSPLVGNNTNAGFIVPFIVPPGSPRMVKVTLQFPAFGSSAAAGTVLQASVYIGNATTLLANATPQVKVASDFDALQVTGITSGGSLAPGSYTAQAWTAAGAAGTLTAGAGFLVTQMYVELV